MIRDVVVIDRETCNGCGQCVTGCHEGALQVIDGKAVLVSELMCDGLGACIGECPVGAISIEKKDAEAYSEITVMKNMVSKGRNTVLAHLKHLKDHGEYAFLNEGIHFLQSNQVAPDFNVETLISEIKKDEKKVDVPPPSTSFLKVKHDQGQGCPGSRTSSFAAATGMDNHESANSGSPSALTHWPVQLHLINPAAGHFKNSDLILAADCVAISLGNFHTRWLKGKTVAIACPKLDSDKEIYVKKLTTLIDMAEVNTITVMIMEVPCCGGLNQLASMAAANATRKVPIKTVVVGIQGEILREYWN